MITLDFSGLHEPKCKGVDSPGTESSDFELWSPHDDGRHGSNDKCFLGQQVTYIRRKQDSECFNGEDFERQTMRVPCLCTDADYECDMNYVRNKGGQCVEIEDTKKKNGERLLSEKEEDCAIEGFYYVSKGYRKIPGDMCYAGVQLDPVRKPCTSFAWFSSMINLKSIFLFVVIVGAFYYGWPIIEAIILVLPIPDPKDTVESMKSYASAATGMVSGAVSSSGPRGGQPNRNQYSANLDAPIDNYLNDEEDDSEEDIGTPLDLENKGLSYKSDEEEKVDTSAGSELIDLGSAGTTNKSPAKIPKLSGPK